MKKYSDDDDDDDVHAVSELKLNKYNAKQNHQQYFCSFGKYSPFCATGCHLVQPKSS